MITPVPHLAILAIMSLLLLIGIMILMWPQKQTIVCMLFHRKHFLTKQWNGGWYEGGFIDEQRNTSGCFYFRTQTVCQKCNTTIKDTTRGARLSVRLNAYMLEQFRVHSGNRSDYLLPYAMSRLICPKHHLPYTSAGARWPSLTIGCTCPKCEAHE